MKAKEKVQALINICNECNPEQEALFAIYATKKKGDYLAVGDMDLVHRGIYEILKKGIAGEENDPKTVVAWSILEALKDLYILEDMEAWNPNIRSKTSIRSTPTRHFVDTSIACRKHCLCCNGSCHLECSCQVNVDFI